jgi:hypothetical protein
MQLREPGAPGGVETIEREYVAVAANELTSDHNPTEKAVSSSRIRALLGERLKDYYARLQHIPASDRIQVLVLQLEKKLQEEGEGAEGTGQRPSN